MAMIRYAQLQQHDDTNHARYLLAGDRLADAERETQKIIEDVEAVIEKHDIAGRALKEAAAGLQGATSRAEQLDLTISRKGKEREVEASESSDDGHSDDSDLPKTPAGAAHAAKKRGLQQRLRECRLLMHRIKFLQGDVWHVRGDMHAAAEKDAYDIAEQIRRLLLKSKRYWSFHQRLLIIFAAAEDAAKRAMAQLTEDKDANDLTQQALLVKPSLLGRGGIRSADLVRENFLSRHPISRPFC